MKHQLSIAVGILLLFLFTVGYAEEDSASNTPVYQDGVLVSYPENCQDVIYHVLPGTKAIGEYAFQGNEYIENVVLPDSLLIIEDSAFAGCTKLKSIEIPDSTLIVGDSAFSYCRSLSQVALSKNVYYLGANAFSETSIEEIALPETLHYLGDEAFALSGIKKVSFAGTPRYIGWEIFTPSSANPIEVTIGSPEYAAFENLLSFYEEDAQKGNILFTIIDSE